MPPETFSQPEIFGIPLCWPGDLWFGIMQIFWLDTRFLYSTWQCCIFFKERNLFFQIKVCKTPPKTFSQSEISAILLYWPGDFGVRLNLAPRLSTYIINTFIFIFSICAKHVSQLFSSFQQLECYKMPPEKFSAPEIRGIQILWSGLG
jgi:hypothetical protein